MSVRRATTVRKAAPIVLLVVAAVGAFIFLNFPFRHPGKFLIPDGYTGWVIVEHDVKGAPPLPVEGITRVYRFPKSGRLKTSSPFEPGEIHDAYYYVRGSELIPIPEYWPGTGIDSEVQVRRFGYAAGLPDEGIPPIEYVFIGTKSQHEKADSPKSEAQEARDKAF